MKYLSHYTEKAQTELINKTGAFFAFSNEQLNRQKKEGTKYTFFKGSGMFVPTENKEELLEGLEKIQEEGIKKDVEENGAKGIIRREYFNHECHIPCDTYDARIALEKYQEMYPEKFSEDVLKKVFAECWKDAVEQDLF